MAETATAAPTTSPRAPVSPRDPRLTGWRSFLTAYSVITRRLDEELREETGLSLFEYAALLQLAEAKDRKLRMSDLALGIVLTRSGVTRLVDRLERAGLVERCQCSSDGRGAEAQLKFLDLCAESRLRHVTGLGRAAEMQLICDCDQIPELLQGWHPDTYDR